METFFLVATMGLGLALLGAPLISRDLAELRVLRRLTRLCGAADMPPEARRALSARLRGLVVGLGRVMLGRGDAARELSGRLAVAGWPERDAPALFAGGRVLGAMALGSVAFLLAAEADAVRNTAIAVILGWLAPGLMLDRWAKWRARRLRAELPVAIDVLSMVLESGAGIEQALRFSISLTPHPAPVALDAFTDFVRDMERGTPYELSLARLGNLAIEEASLFVEVLRQSLVHGTEVVEPLRRLAEELRQRRLADARAAVGRAATLMTLVMVVCLMPALLILIGAPAFDGISAMFGRF